MFEHLVSAGGTVLKGNVTSGGSHMMEHGRKGIAGGGF